MSSRKEASPTFTVRLAHRALADLRAIRQYSLETWGQQSTDRYLEGISSALDRLKATPQMLQVLPEFAPGLYFYLVEKHYLACDFDGNSIIILAVIHTSMDIPARLPELQPQLMTEVQYLRQQLRHPVAPR